MTARYIVADVFDGLKTIPDASVDLIVTSPPFLALRSYLPSDHPDKAREIGSEATPAEFIDVLLRVTAELRRVLAPHGSICVELGDTYAGSATGGERTDGGMFGYHPDGADRQINYEPRPSKGSEGWPLAKSRTLIPQLYEIALAYGINPLTGNPSPAGQWRIRNVVTWARPNPPVGALGDKWRPATSDLIVACTSSKRYWDDLATRKPVQHPDAWNTRAGTKLEHDGGNRATLGNYDSSMSSGAPLLDYWEIPPGGYKGSHYAVFPEELVVPCVKAMCPERVCRTCGEPSRRIVSKLGEERGDIADAIETARLTLGLTRRDMVPLFIGHYKNEESVLAQISNWELGKNVPVPKDWHLLKSRLGVSAEFDDLIEAEARWNDATYEHVSDHPSGWTQDASGRVHQRLPARKNRIEPKPEWTSCGHDDYRPGLVLDPFAGSGTTLSVATGHGHDAVGIDVDRRNVTLARERIGPFFFEEVDIGELQPEASG